MREDGSPYDHFLKCTCKFSLNFAATMRRYCNRFKHKWERERWSDILFHRNAFLFHPSEKNRTQEKARLDCSIMFTQVTNQWRTTNMLFKRKIHRKSFLHGGLPWICVRCQAGLVELSPWEGILLILGARWCKIADLKDTCPSIPFQSAMS